MVNLGRGPGRREPSSRGGGHEGRGDQFGQTLPSAAVGQSTGQPLVYGVKDQEGAQRQNLLVRHRHGGSSPSAQQFVGEGAGLGHELVQPCVIEMHVGDQRGK